MVGGYSAHGSDENFVLPGNNILTDVQEVWIVG
jgi:hypothetical protein